MKTILDNNMKLTKSQRNNLAKVSLLVYEAGEILRKKIYKGKPSKEIAELKMSIISLLRNEKKLTC